MILKSNLKCLYDVGVGHYLAPGNNPIPDAVYAVMKEVPDFKSKLKNGTFSIVQKPVDEADAPPVPEGTSAADAVAQAQARAATTSPLAEVPEKKALAAIPDIHDVNQLRAIADLDPREKVAKAAVARMEKIRADMEKDGQKDHTDQDV